MPGDILAAKLALEAELTPVLARLMRGYARVWQARRGQFQPFERMAWLGLFDAALKRHYGRTVAVFRGLTPPRRPVLTEIAVSADHAAALEDMAREQAARILTGLDRDLVRHSLGVRHKATQVPRSSDAPFGQRWLKSGTVAFETKADKPPKFSVHYAARSGPRAAAIANVNTQAVAEDTRWRVVDNDKAAGVITKIWVSLLDGRERPAHRAAHDHPAIGVEGRFVVGGEELRFPGDTKFGASLGNVINCRCTAVYRLERPDGSVDEITSTVRAPARRQRRAGDKPGITRPATPTSAVTLNGHTRATVALADGSLANLTQEADRLTIRVNRQVVARATIVRRGANEVALDGLDIADRFAERGIASLLHNSVETSLAREGRRLVPPRLMSDELFAFWRRRNPSAVANDIRSVRDAIAKWARAEHGAAALLRFDADGSTVRILLAGGRQLILTRADLEALGLWTPTP